MKSGMDSLCSQPTAFKQSCKSCYEIKRNKISIILIIVSPDLHLHFFPFRKAGECEVDENEEEWLHHYMLGKVAEKKGADPEEYLKHYKQVRSII